MYTVCSVGVSMHAILEEAEFYNIASLVTLVKQQLDEPKSEDEEKTMVGADMLLLLLLLLIALILIPASC